MLLPLTAVIVAIAVFCTATLSGIFGMAGGLVLLGVMLTLLPVASAIAVQGAIQVVANGSRAWFSREHIDWRILGFICLGLIMAALALLVLRYVPDLMIVCFAIGLMPILVWIPKGWLALDASKPHHAMLCGFLGGGLNLAIGVSGPIVDIFFIRTQMDRRRIVATKAATQVISHLSKVLFYGMVVSAVAANDWLLALIAAPFAVPGTSLGYHILQRMSDDGFRTWTRRIVTGIGIFYLGRGFSLLLGS
ncbi:sulfite exporter TauE/SafE family protein [Devosia sp. YIM 151766]|uniref:sulfite exporter TauE/SafE family protein n=1 Tax=Devosia sp. YIM 151766 TaxID=3017325 RepID=UPI00255D0FEF|nr:sulfite exporter TauE/SafE family protein [Devosia sp. YIM 151766]WIY53462.1 sulfite exporter TauE/SafE family protein [Devosia sp. YIM 151766]